MKFKKYNVSHLENLKFSINNTNVLKVGRIVWILCFLCSCESFLELDPPKDKLVSDAIFDDPTLVESTLANIYYKIREQGMVYGGVSGLSIKLAIYTDELDYLGSNDENLKVYTHTIMASDATVSNWWNQAYNLIYVANDIIKGMENSDALSVEDKNNYKGQALFVRGYLHSLLVGIYGDIPYIKRTNYLENNVAQRMPVVSVYEHIIEDLTSAIPLLDDPSGERIYPNTSAARALLARMYLYTEQWALAEAMATSVINVHTLEPDLKKVFLKGSQETLWQFSPGSDLRNTWEGQTLIIRSVPTNEGYPLTNDLLEAFETGDLRYKHWVDSITSSDGLITLYFAHKYKEVLINTRQPSLEYSIVFRLAEQYLIRSEARSHLGDILGAQTDLNTIRHRAGLGDTTATTLDSLLADVLQERRVELFTEHGQRWFDLKRMGKASDVLAPIKPNWEDSHILFPIPDTELLANPNLTQNDGY